MFRDTHVF